jgi:hypothetical protein
VGSGMGFNDVVGSGRHGLGEDDGAAGPSTAGVISVVGLGMTRGVEHHELGEDNVDAGSGTASRAWG